MIAVPIGKIGGISRVAFVCGIPGNRSVLHLKMSVRDESAVSLPITRMAHVANPGSRSYLQTRYNSRPNTIQVPVHGKFSVGMRDHDHVPKVRTAWINLVAGRGAPVAQHLGWVGHHECQLHNATAGSRHRVTYGAARRLRAHVNAGVILA